MVTGGDGAGGERAARARPAVVTLIDPREEFYENFRRSKGMDLREQYRSSHLGLLEELQGQEAGPVDLGVLDRKEDIYRAAADAVARGCAGIVLNLPGWAPPGWAGIIHAAAALPILVHAPFALSGPMAARGELEALGAEHYLSLGEPEKVREFLEVIAAGSLLASLRGKRFGNVGGLGMEMHYAEVASSSALLDFGVEVVHIDGAGVLGRAQAVEPARLQAFLSRLEGETGGCPGGSQAVFSRQASYYLALKDLLEEEGVDFAAVKCQPEFSDRHGCLCFAPTFLPMRLDPEGPKRMVPVSCEGDFFASLAGYLLMLLAGEPPFFCDFIIPLYEENLLALQNCGGAPAWYADGGDTGDLSGVGVVENVQGKSGSCCFQFSARELESVTLLGLGKRPRGYWAGTCRGQVVKREELRPLLMDWPTLFLKVEDARGCLRRFFSQHVMLAPGDFTSVLARLGERMGAGDGA